MAKSAIRQEEIIVSFSKLGGLHALTEAPVMTLTASVPPDVEAVISKALHLRDPVLVTQSLNNKFSWASVSCSPFVFTNFLGFHFPFASCHLRSKFLVMLKIDRRGDSIITLCAENEELNIQVQELQAQVEQLYKSGPALARQFDAVLQHGKQIIHGPDTSEHFPEFSMKTC